MGLSLEGEIYTINLTNLVQIKLSLRLANSLTDCIMDIKNKPAVLSKKDQSAVFLTEWAKRKKKTVLCKMAVARTHRQFFLLSICSLLADLLHTESEKIQRNIKLEQTVSNCYPLVYEFINKSLVTFHYFHCILYGRLPLVLTHTSETCPATTGGSISHHLLQHHHGVNPVLMRLFVFIVCSVE